MCNSPDDTNRRVKAQAELMESCARVIRASLQSDYEHIEGASDDVHNIAYNLEQPNINESNED